MRTITAPRARVGLLVLALCFMVGVGTQARAAPAFVVAEDARAAARAIAKAGGEVGHVFPPHVLFARARDPEALARLPGIVSVASGEVQPGGMSRWGPVAELAAAAWNQSLRPQPSTVQTGPEPPPIQDDMRRVPEPIASARALGAAQAGAPPYGAGRYDISEYMAGKVAVGIILPESTGSGENWTSARQSQVVSAIQQAMNWWAAREPMAHLTFYYDIHLSVPTSYEPIQMSSYDEDLWINQVLGNLGYTDSSYFERTFSYDNAIRNALGTDWAFSIFVVDSYNDHDGNFTDGYFAYAYLGGPFMVMTYDNDGYGISNMPAVCAHETGHIFYALDEYAGASSASDTSGYYNTLNGNHQVGGVTNVPCIMRGQIAPYDTPAVCSYSHLQVGHRDLNGDSIEDLLGVPPETALTPYSPDPTTNATLTYTGTATVVPLANQNPISHTQPPPAITINTIAGVDYRVDGGAWQPATATDGSFGRPQQNFTFTMTVAAGGTRSIEARARDSSGNVDATPALDTVTVISPVHHFAVQVIPAPPEPQGGDPTDPLPFTVRVEARNGNDALAPSYNGTAALTASVGTASLASLSFSGGVWEGQVTIAASLDPDCTLTVTDSGLGVSGTSPVFALRGKGDVDASGSVNVLDVIRTVNLALLKPVPAFPRYAFQFWAGDMNRDHSVNVLDVIQIVNKSLGRAPAPPAGVSALKAAAPSAGPVEVTVTPARGGAWAIRVSNAAGLAGAQFEIACKQGEVAAGELAGGWQVQSNWVNGRLRVIAYSASASGLATGDGTLLRLTNVKGKPRLASILLSDAAGTAIAVR